MRRRGVPAVSAGSSQLPNIQSGGAPVHIRVIRGRASCDTARRTLRRYLASNAPCDGQSCVRDHGAWTCQAAAGSTFSRLASCVSGRSHIAAYSTAD